MTPLFQSEVQLASWSETHHGGAKVTLWLADPEELAAFKALTLRAGGKAGQRLACVLVAIGDDEKPKAPPPAQTSSVLAQELHRRGYFRNVAVWRALHESGAYTVQQHRQSVLKMNCLLHKKGGCAGDVVLHHTRSASLPAAGKHLQPENPMKVPHWYGIPLCDEHHMRWAHATATKDDHQWMLEQAIGIMAKKAHSAYRALSGLESLAYMTEEELHDIEAQIGFAPAG